MALVNMGTGQVVSLGSIYSSQPICYVSAPDGATLGMTVPQLQAALASAQAALGAGFSGNRAVAAAYGQGNGSKSVTFNMTSTGQIRGWIMELQRALGIVGVARRPMRPFF